MHGLLLQQRAGHEADHQPHGGVIVLAFAEEEPRQRGQQQNAVEGGLAADPAGQQGNHQGGQQAHGPAGHHVRGIVSAHHNPGEAHQQGQRHRQHRRPFLLQLPGDGRIHGGRVGGVAAGKGIALGRDIHGMGVRLNHAEDFDLLRMGHIRPQAQHQVLDLRVPAHGRQRRQPHPFSHVLVIPPVEDPQDQNQNDLLAEGGEEGDDARPRAAQGILQPLLQADLPGEEKRIARQFHFDFSASCQTPYGKDLPPIRGTV